jgi:hypothetical protein
VAARAGPKYQAQAPKIAPSPRKAALAAETDHVGCPWIPFITAIIDSPKKMRVNRPTRSGRCSASGGSVPVCRAVRIVVAASTSAAIAHSQARAGIGTTADSSQIAAPRPMPAAHSKASRRAGAIAAARRYCPTSRIRMIANAATKPAVDSPSSVPSALAAMKVTANICSSVSAQSMPSSEWKRVA